MRKAVSPVAATILLILIAIAGGVIIYTYTMEFFPRSVEPVLTKIRCVDSPPGFYLFFFEDGRKVDEIYIESGTCEELGNE